MLTVATSTPLAYDTVAAYHASRGGDVRPSGPCNLRVAVSSRSSLTSICQKIGAMLRWQRTTLAYDSAAAQHVSRRVAGMSRAYPWDGTREITKVLRASICLYGKRRSDFGFRSFVDGTCRRGGQVLFSIDSDLAIDVCGPHSSSKPLALSCRSLLDEVRNESTVGHQGEDLQQGASCLAR
jgi:hypothetical protein